MECLGSAALTDVVFECLPQDEEVEGEGKWPTWMEVEVEERWSTWEDLDFDEVPGISRYD